MTSLNDAEISNNATAPKDTTSPNDATSSQDGEIMNPNYAETSSDAEPWNDAEIPNNATGPSDATTPNDATGPNDTTVPNDATTSDDAQIENLKTLFGDLLVEFLSVVKSDQPNQPETLRKKLLGIRKGLSREIGAANPLDYEQKYPEDKPEEVLANNARVWLTYLDEAGAYDRDKVEGWKDTVDALLVFAGLFSGVITTFVSQASQSLQQDYTQVSASLASETVQLLRAGFSGTPVSDVPMSTLTPTSPFKPSTNAFLVNGLWFTSLAISLATALVAVLTKQWLYYYMSTPPGTAIEKVRIRHFRFKGLEFWKVSLIVDLLPIFLHLALGVFLIGVIIFLFPLDDRIAWVIVVITGITYTLYFISVILPIRYPDCPYTTSLATFAGNVFYFLSGILSPILSLVINLCNYFKRSLYFQDLGQRVLYRKKTWHTKISHCKNQLLGNCTSTATPTPTPTPTLTPAPFSVPISTIRRIQATPSTPPSRIRHAEQVKAVIRTVNEKNGTDWRERNLKKAIQANSGVIELKALEWLHITSSNLSIRRIVAWGVSVHPGPVQVLSRPVLDEMRDNVWVAKYTGLQYLRHRLCMYYQFWCSLGVRPPSLTEEAFEGHPDYSRLAGDMVGGKYSKVLKTALVERLELPPLLWRWIMDSASEDRDATAVACVLTSIRYPFPGRRDFDSRSRVSNSTYDTGDVSFGAKQLNKWVFDYLFDFFCHDALWQLDHLSETSVFDKRYLLFVYIYRNLTSNDPVITDEEKRELSLEALFEDFQESLYVSPPQHISPEWPLTLFRDISLPDMELNSLRPSVAYWSLIDAPLLKASGSSCFFMRYQSEDISFIYKWFSRNIPNPFNTVIGMILLMPQNRDYLLKEISGDLHPTALSHLCQCLGGLYEARHIKRKYIYPNLIHLFRTKYGTDSGHLFNNLYDFSVLVEAWKHLVESDELDEKFLRIIKSRLGPERSRAFLDMMRQDLENESFEGHRDILRKSANEFEDILNRRPAPNSTFFSKIPDLVSRALYRRRDYDVERGAQLQETDAIELVQVNSPSTSNGNVILNP